MAASRVTTDSVSGRKTWRWQETHQIATYLMSIAVAKYTAIPDTTNPLIVNYVRDEWRARHELAFPEMPVRGLNP